jgi:hypothetical protein
MVASIRLMAVTSGGNGINVEKTPLQISLSDHILQRGDYL